MKGWLKSKFTRSDSRSFSKNDEDLSQYAKNLQSVQNDYTAKGRHKSVADPNGMNSEPVKPRVAYKTHNLPSDFAGRVLKLEM